MKKSMKKLTALLLAMVMVLAMGLTSFAATNDDEITNPVTVKVTIQNPNGGYFLDNQSVTLDKNKSLYTLTDAAIIENNGTATAIDAIIKAVNNNINYYKVQYVEYGTWEPIDQYGLAFDTLNGIKGTSVDNEDGTTTYFYWEVKINGTSAANYATNYVLTDGMEIEVLWSSYVY